MTPNTHTTGSPVTRRDWLGYSLAASAAVATAGVGRLLAREPERDQPEDPMAGWIDAHSHIWTPDTGAYPLASGYKKEGMKPPSFTPDELFSHAGPCGVTRVVLIQMSFYGFDNRYMLDAIRDRRGVFSGVAVIDRDQEHPERQMRQLKEQGVRGFRIRPWDRDRATWLAGDGMARMWQCGAEENLAMCHLIDPDSLPAVDQMCGKHPDTPVVIDHLCRVGVDGTVRDADVQALCDLARHEQVHLKVSAFYALGKKSPPYDDLAPLIRRVYEAYGPQRLMWASDCPFQVDPGHSYAESIDLVRERLEFLTDDDRQWLLRKTAEKVFFQ
jgi:predicted TIM-barrel fold metal-dependent hydrolase